MMNATEKTQARYVLTRLNEIVNLTHNLRLEFNEDAEQVLIYTMTTKKPIKIVSVADDSAAAILDDVMAGIGEL